MRTTWNGSISFGLVNIPIGLAPATKPAARASDVSFRLLHRECKTPIKQKRWCPVHDREVGPDEIVKGWEVSKGEFVIVEEDDLEAIERDSTSRAIDITGFVPADTVDPIYFDRTYFLVPAAAVAARRPYVLLQHAMQETGMAALGRFVLAGKEKLCLIRAHGDGLALETMYLAEDVYSQAEIDEAVAEADVKDAEVALARQIIDSMVTEFQPAEQLTSEYRQDLRELLGAKLKGQEPARPGAGRGAARDRPDGGPAPQRRGGAEAQGAGVARPSGEAGVYASPTRQGEVGLAALSSGRREVPGTCLAPKTLERRAPLEGPAEVVSRLGRFGSRGADSLELCLEEELVDLALIDRHAFLDTEPDHVVTIEPELFGQLFRRQVIWHRLPP